MIEDIELKTLESLIQQIRETLCNSDINPLNGMNLVALAARKVIADIARDTMLSKDEAIVKSLGAMLPKSYLLAITHSNENKNGSSVAR